jgi:hypothetical protein
MDGLVESAVELMQDGRSQTGLSEFIDAHPEETLAYMSLSSTSPAQKHRKLSTIEFIRKGVAEGRVPECFYTKRFLGSAGEMRRNAAKKRMAGSVVEACYESYFEIVKHMLERDPSSVLDILEEHFYRGSEEDYVTMIVRCADFHPMIDLFAVFFAREGRNLSRWLQLIKQCRVVGKVLGGIEKKRRAGKEYQNLVKILHILLSFTGTIIRREEAEGDPADSLCFFSEVERRAPCILRLLFSEDEYFNRTALAELLKQILYKAESLGRTTALFSELAALIRRESSCTETSPMEILDEDAPADSALLKMAVLTDLLARTIKFRNTEIRDAVHETRFIERVVRYSAEIPRASLLLQNVLYLIREMFGANKTFYCDAIISFCRGMRSLSFEIPRRALARSYGEFSPHHSMHDNITPIFYEMVRLAEECAFESNVISVREKGRTGGSGDRFVPIDNEDVAYKISKELLFMESEEWAWYLTGIMAEYRRRMGMDYLRGPRDRVVEVNEQFARYLCSLVGCPIKDLDGTYFA